MNVLGSFCPLPPFSTPKMTHSAGEFDVEQLTQDIATAFLNEPNPKLTGQFGRTFGWNDEENAFDVGFEPTAADCEAIGTMVAIHIFAMCTDVYCTVPAVVSKDGRFMLRDAIKMSMLVHDTADTGSSVIEDREMIETHFSIEGDTYTDEHLGKWVLRLTLHDNVFDRGGFDMETLKESLHARFGKHGEWICADDNDRGYVLYNPMHYVFV